MTFAPVHPSRLAACFDGGLPAAVAAALLATPRFAGRVDQVLVAQYGAFADDAPADPADRHLCALDRAALEALSFRAGVVLHAHAFVREIRGPVIAEMAARFGEGALSDARAHVDLAADRARMADLDLLDAAIRADGLACLAAWLGALPPEAHRRLALAWPDEAAVPRTRDADIMDRGPAILRRLASAPPATTE